MREAPGAVVAGAHLVSSRQRSIERDEQPRNVVVGLGLSVEGVADNMHRDGHAIADLDDHDGVAAAAASLFDHEVVCVRCVVAPQRLCVAQLRDLVDPLPQTARRVFRSVHAIARAQQSTRLIGDQAGPAHAVPTPCRPSARERQRRGERAKQLSAHGHARGFLAAIMSRTMPCAS